MKLVIKFSEINNLLKSANMQMKLYGMGADCFSVTYDPGVLLPTVSLYLKEPVVSSSYVRFRYDSQQSFLLKAANFLSVLPSGITLDTNKKMITVTPSRLSALSKLGFKIRIENLHVYNDSLDLEFTL